jgi:biopolymer transport protein ExbB
MATLAASVVPAAQVAQVGQLDSVFELVKSGGPLMIPIGLCSVVALAYATERWVRLRPGLLGSGGFAKRVLHEIESGGASAALALCIKNGTPLARVLARGLERAGAPFLDREKAVEDAADSEVRRLSLRLRPLMLVYLIAPLLGLLGTVWGMIEAFSEIALEQGLGRPELLAAGIYQALTTTAAGLAVAIPAIVMHHHLDGRIENFVRRCEETWSKVDRRLAQAEA